MSREDRNGSQPWALISQSVRPRIPAARFNHRVLGNYFGFFNRRFFFVP